MYITGYSCMGIKYWSILYPKIFNHASILERLFSLFINIPLQGYKNLFTIIKKIQYFVVSRYMSFMLHVENINWSIYLL